MIGTTDSVVPKGGIRVGKLNIVGRRVACCASTSDQPDGRQAVKCAPIIIYSQERGRPLSQRNAQEILKPKDASARLE
jgi:hypothetical protein